MEFGWCGPLPVFFAWILLGILEANNATTKLRCSENARFRWHEFWWHGRRRVRLGWWGRTGVGFMLIHGEFMLILGGIHGENPVVIGGKWVLWQFFPSMEALICWGVARFRSCWTATGWGSQTGKIGGFPKPESLSLAVCPGAGRRSSSGGRAGLEC